MTDSLPAKLSRVRLQRCEPPCPAAVSLRCISPLHHLNLLDRHIFKNVLFTCAGAVGLFAFVVALPNVIRDLLGPLLAGQLTPAAFVRLVALIFPFALSLALPMGLLTGVLLTLGRLSADSEITAMRAAGISVMRVSRPVLLLGVLGACAGLYINFESMPWARVQYHREFAEAVRTKPLNFIVPKTFIRDFKDCVIYVGDRQGVVLRDVSFWKLDDQKRVVAYERSETGRLDYDEVTNELAVTLTPAQITTPKNGNPDNFTDSPIVNLFGVSHRRFSLERYFGQQGMRVKQEWLTYAELQAERTRLAAQTPAPADASQLIRDRMKLDLVLHDKFNLSLTVFSFALIGVPLGIRVSRRETSANLGLALLLVLGYYFLTVMVKWLDRHPEYRPDLLLWLPNVLFLTLGVWLFSRIDRK